MRTLTQEYNSLLTSKGEFLQQLNQEKISLETFILRIKDEISVSCNLPTELPDRNLLSVIEECKKWFYENYRYALEQGYLLIENAYFNTPFFQKNTYIQLPKSVYSVSGIVKVGAKDMSSYINFSKYRNEYIRMSDQSVIGEDLMSFVIADAYTSLRSQLLDKLAMNYDFNHLTKKFKILGETPKDSVVLKVKKTIDDDSLFEDMYFFRYVVAKCYRNLSRLYGTFQYNLPGGVTINFDNLKSMGDEEIEKIEEQIKSENTADWFLVY